MPCQIQISFNAFNVSIQGIVDDLGIPASSVGLALTTATFAMAGFVLLGARLAARIGDFRKPDLTVEDEEGIASGTRST